MKIKKPILNEFVPVKDPSDAVLYTLGINQFTQFPVPTEAVVMLEVFEDFGDGPQTSYHHIGYRFVRFSEVKRLQKRNPLDFIRFFARKEGENTGQEVWFSKGYE